MKLVELVITATGGAILEDKITSAVLWSGDDDPDFMEEFGEDFLTPDDFEDVLEYLVDEGILTDEEANAAELSEEETDGEAKPTAEFIPAEKNEDT